MLKTNVKQIIKRVVSSHKKMSAYYENTISWGRGSKVIMNNLEAVVTIDTRNALDELDAYIKDLNSIRRGLAKADRKIEGNSIDQYTLTVEGDTFTVKRFGEVYLREVI